MAFFRNILNNEKEEDSGGVMEDFKDAAAKHVFKEMVKSSDKDDMVKACLQQGVEAAKDIAKDVCDGDQKKDDDDKKEEEGEGGFSAAKLKSTFSGIFG